MRGAKRLLRARGRATPALLVLRSRRSSRASPTAPASTPGLGAGPADCTEQTLDCTPDLLAYEIPDHGDEALLSRHRHDLRK